MLVTSGVGCPPGVATYCRQSATPVAAEAGVAGSGSDSGSDSGSGSGSGSGSVGCYGELTAELDPAERRELDSEGRCMITLHRTTYQVRRNADLLVAQ